MKRPRLDADTLPQNHQTGEGNQHGSVALSHRVYDNISANDNSRNVYGDIYNTYHVHPLENAGAPADSSDHVTKTMMNALAFDQMDTRLATVSTAHAETCQWIFAREEYTSWRNPEALHKHHGLFWIKGKPGAGKSTLMKCARQYGEDTHKDLTISFFFSAGGGALQKSAEGMYRSLLYQLLDAIPRLAPAFGNPRRRPPKHSWPVAELETMLEKTVQALGSNAVTCYIDALDECDDAEARKMIEHFETLGRCAVKADTEFRVLLSSRHYPRIFLDDCLELNLENQEGHEADIAEYIRSKLKIGKGSLALEIQDEIQTRACGVFLWVVLVIRILNEHDARGKRHLLKQRLAAIPAGLSELFEELLQRDAHDADETLLTLQWILFAQRPLRRDELYHAVITNSSEDAISQKDHEEIDSDVMERFLLDSSKGLAETTKGNHPTVQFIHGSVRDYLLGKGLAIIEPKLSKDIFSISHERLRDCCLHYLEASQDALLHSPDIRFKPQMRFGSKQVSPFSAFWNKAKVTRPFLSYVVQGIFYHANLAHTTSRPQDAFVARFPHEIWRTLYNTTFFGMLEPIKLGAQPLWTFVAMRALELARVEIQNNSSHVESRLEGERHPTLLDVTVANEDQCMMELLLNNGAVPNDYSNPPASSYLSRAIAMGNSTMVRTLIDHGAGPICVKDADLGKPGFVESLSYALDQITYNQEVLECILTREPYSIMPHWSELLTETLFVSQNFGFHSIQRLLLRRMELVKNFTSSKLSAIIAELDNVFVAACGHRQLALVKIMIEHNILQASNKIAQAFKAAVRNGDDEMVQTLLESGVEVDMRLDDLDTTALIVASVKGHANLVKLLLQNGAEVPSQCIALYLAAGKGHVAIVQMLLEAGADPNTRHDYPIDELLFVKALHADPITRHDYPDDEPQWDTALHMAVRNGSAETVRVLLDHASIDADALDGYGEHAIRTACEWCRFDCVQLLLERDIPLQHLNNAAAIAWGEDSDEIVHMLVAKGAIFRAE